MVTHSLSRTTRYAALPLLVLAVLTVAIFLHAHWGAFLQWCLAVQISLHRYLVMYLLQLNNHQYSGGMWLLVGSFMYGVLHAIGPGHGKFIVTTWITTHQENTAVTRIIPFVGSLLQGVSAILFVFILAVGFNLASGSLSQSRWYIEKISAVFIGLFGLWVIFQALKSLQPRKLTIRRVQPVPGEPYNHAHHENCGCAHHHISAVPLAQASWKTRLGVMFTVGARPCSGAIMILMFANALGIVTWGIAAVMTMALGTGLSIMGLSLAVRYAREKTLAMFGGHTANYQWLLPCIRVLGGILLVLFATVLFLTVIPVSANGDYIAAGC
jgi:ABC-type nickel/cobalt efflux system permease component RcnA